MKKLHAVLLVVAIMSVVSSGARAAALETGGEIRVRGWWLDNYVKDGARTEFWDQRLRLTMYWPVAENVRIRVRADILEGMWGDVTPVPTEAAAAAPPPGSPVPAATVPGAQPRQQIAFDWVNMQFEWPGTPLRFTIGRQDVSWGTGFWVQADNRDRFQVAAKLHSVIIVAAYDKFVEVAANHDPLDDQQGWASGPSPTRRGSGSVFSSPTCRTGAAPGSRPGMSTTWRAMSSPRARSAPRNSRRSSTTAAARSIGTRWATLDLGGLGGYAGVFLPVGPSVSIGLEGAYTRGDDPRTTGRNEGVFSADYEGPYWSVIFYNNMDYSGYGGDNQSSSFGADFGVRNASPANSAPCSRLRRNSASPARACTRRPIRPGRASTRRWVGSST